MFNSTYSIADNLTFKKKFAYIIPICFRKNNGNLQLDDNHIITTFKWAQNRISTLNDLVKEDLAFLWIVPSSMPNVKEDGCSGINIFLYKEYPIYQKLCIITLFQMRLSY